MPSELTAVEIMLRRNVALPAEKLADPGADLLALALRYDGAALPKRPVDSGAIFSYCSPFRVGSHGQKRFTAPAAFTSRRTPRVRVAAPMLGITFGAVSFLVIFWVDVAAVRKVRPLPPLLWAAGSALFLTGIVETIGHSALLPLPLLARVIGYLLSGLFLLLLLYSLFIELAVSAPGSAGGGPRLFTRGTSPCPSTPGCCGWRGC